MLQTTERASKLQKSLEQLIPLPEGKLTQKKVGSLTKLGEDAVRYRSSQGFNYKNKKAVAQLIKESAPLFEGWIPTRKAVKLTGFSRATLNKWIREENQPFQYARRIGDQTYFNPEWIQQIVSETKGWYQTEEVQEALGLEGYLLRGWAKNPKTREKISAKKIRGYFYFNPDWVQHVKDEMQKYGGRKNLIAANEAAALLGVERQRLSRWKTAFHVINPAGAKNWRLYPKNEIQAMKKAMDEIAKKKYLKTREVAYELSIPDDIVRRKIPPAAIHPVTRELLYFPSTLERYRNRVFVRYTPLKEILAACEKKEKNPWLTSKIRMFINRRAIPQEHEEGDPLIYLPLESQEMIKRIYQNYRTIRNRGRELMSTKQAGKIMGIKQSQLNRVLRRYGKEVVLSQLEIKIPADPEGRGIFNPPTGNDGRGRASGYYTQLQEINSLEVSIEQNNGTTFPVIPFIRIIPEGHVRYLSDATVYYLKSFISEVKQRARRECFRQTFHSHMYQQLAERILSQNRTTHPMPS